MCGYVHMNAVTSGHPRPWIPLELKFQAVV